MAVRDGCVRDFALNRMALAGATQRSAALGLIFASEDPASLSQGLVSKAHDFERIRAKSLNPSVIVGVMQTKHDPKQESRHAFFLRASQTGNQGCFEWV